ncbi:MAG TPA: HNH endonuclease signature motif containing protein, partial [Streptosporangiaceae bacterium]
HMTQPVESASTPGGGVPDPSEALEAAPLPTERLEAELCALAGHITAATCRFLIFLGEFDARRGWASWDMAAGMTASQTDRFARAYHQCKEREEQDRPGYRAPRKGLRWRFDEDTGGITFTVQLPPEQGAVVLQALRAAAGDLEHPTTTTRRGGGTRRTRSPPAPARNRSGSALPTWPTPEVAGAYLREKITSAGNAGIYQVIIHTTPQALSTPPGADPGHVPAGTPAGHPAWPGRCHIEDGPAITPAAAQMIACDATASTMVHDPGSGENLSLGRRSRRATPAIRRAVRERDRYRCTPGCDSRRTDLHHITWWSNGGHTSTANLQLLCKAHHAIVHDKGYLITRRPGGYTFTRPDGLTLTAPPALPAPAGHISQTHDAAITPRPSANRSTANDSTST